MQQDFHYNTIKVICEKVGLTPAEAQLVAYASQFIDDATIHDSIKISGVKTSYPRYDGEEFDPVCTAHRGIQFIKGLYKSVQRRIYIPFHFIPYDRYEKKGKFDYLTYPNGKLARELVQRALKFIVHNTGNKRHRALIKLGIALHTYADTWAHQGFSGRQSTLDNDIGNIHIYRNGEWDKIGLIKQLEFNLLPDIGHAEAWLYPDQSHLIWKYDCAFRKKTVTRNNTEIFLDAAKHIFEILAEGLGTTVDCQPFLEKFKQCFSLQTDDLHQKYDMFKLMFPEVKFHYSETEWRNKAIVAGEHEHTEQPGVSIQEDLTQKKFRFNSDRKWFYFHMEALKQRNWVMKQIKRNLR